MMGRRTWSALAVVLTTVGCAPPGPRQPLEHTESLRRVVHVGPPVDAEISYLIAGNPNGTRVVLVHGTPGSADAWADYLLAPPPGLELVALDRPGFGRSGPVGAITSLATQAAAVAALLAPGDRKTVLLGHSLGGPIVAWLAAEHPGRVSALVLLAASLDPGLEKIHPLQPLGTWWPVRKMLPRALRNANEELMALQPELTALTAMLDRVTAPVIIVHGTADTLVPVANVPFMEAHLAAARCRKTVLLDSANHFLPWNTEAAVRDAIAWAVAPPC